MDEGWIETEFDVRYAETDAMGVVYYANYFVWFEVARGAYCKHHGIDYQAIEKTGSLMAVVDASCRFRAPARYGDTICVRARITEQKRATVSVQYEIYNAVTGQMLATGHTRHMWVNGSGRPVRTPESLKGLLGA